MTDKEILDVVHQMLLQERQKYRDQIQGWLEGDPIIDFIEEQWQRQDDQELVAQYNRNRKAEDHIVDVAEIERHRGLVIGEDGTVKEIL